MKKMTILVFCSLLLTFVGCATKLENVTLEHNKDGSSIAYVMTKHATSADTVVFENSLGMQMNEWVNVLPEISKKATVFAYNRPGYGASSATQIPRDAQHIAAQLHDLLTQKGLKPPYILVGHALGGLYMQYFMKRYPHDVKALVLVDSTHPKQFLAQGSTKEWPRWVRVGFEMRLNKMQLQEFELVEKSGASVLALASPKKTKVIVLSALKPLDHKSYVADYANALRKDMAKLYPNSKQIWVDSGLKMPQENPQPVVQAINDALQTQTRQSK